MEAHKVEAVHELTLDGFQARLDRVELGQAGGPRRAAQSAVEVVAPAVERADQGGAALALGLDGDARAPVTADVVEGTNDAVGAAQNDRALAAEVEADVAARFRQAIGRAHV